jgi:uncharacterized protein (DUF1800 family)
MARYDRLGFQGYVAEQLGNDLAPLTPTGATVADKLDRAVLARRQLEANLLDFWFNHFNVDASGAVVERTVGSFQADIHGALWGPFRQLLLATAKAPAMLDYLDNRFNSAPKVFENYTFGPNENYGRELMELHTMGVDGGYDERDVVEVARVLTGWSMRDDQYLFKPNRHDYGAKEVLGATFPADRGEEEGVELLNMLAAHPSTASFISTKLCRRLVSEAPPSAAVQAGVDVFTTADGNVEATVRAIINSPTFVADDVFRAKVKPPHRYVASAIMAMGATGRADYDAIADELYDSINRLGEEPYRVAPPTGYPEASGFWVSSGTMLARFELAGIVAGHRPLLNRLRETANPAGSGAAVIVDAVAARLCPGGLSAVSRQETIEHVRSASSTADGRLQAAARLVLSSPEFVRF